MKNISGTQSLHLVPRLLQVVSCLLAQMEAVLDLHSGAAVLEAAARTYLSLCGEEMTRCSVSRAARDSLVQRWVDQLTALLEVESLCIFRLVNVFPLSLFTNWHIYRTVLFFSVVGWQFLCWRGENWRNFSHTEETQSFPQVRLTTVLNDNVPVMCT